MCSSVVARVACLQMLHFQEEHGKLTLVLRGCSDQAKRIRDELSAGPAFCFLVFGCFLSETTEASSVLKPVYVAELGAHLCDVQAQASSVSVSKCRSSHRVATELRFHLHVGPSRAHRHLRRAAECRPLDC